MPIMLTGILLLAAGCSETVKEGANEVESDREQNIRAVLNELLNGPSEEQEKILEGPDGDLEKYVKRFDEYNNEHFKPYLSERFYEGFLNTNGTLMFLRLAYPDYELKTEDITLEERENYYTFTVNVSYTNNKSKESKAMNIKGNVQTNEEKKVTSIHIVNFEDFRTALN